MKAVVAVLLGLSLLAAGFGVYRWLGGDDERARAEAAAEDFSAFCRRAGSRCDVDRVEPIADGRWRIRLRDGRCLALDLERFETVPRGMYVSGRVEGLSDTACGPDWWTGREAARRLQRSPWAREHQAELIVCAGRGENRYALYAREFSCRYNTSGGDGIVVLRTTGQDTFELE